MNGRHVQDTSFLWHNKINLFLIFHFTFHFKVVLLFWHNKINFLVPLYIHLILQNEVLIIFDTLFFVERTQLGRISICISLLWDSFVRWLVHKRLWSWFVCLKRRICKLSPPQARIKETRCLRCRIIPDSFRRTSAQFLANFGVWKKKPCRLETAFLKREVSNWWKKSTVIYRVLCIPGGAGFLPSTVSFCPFFLNEAFFFWGAEAAFFVARNTSICLKRFCQVGKFRNWQKRQRF